MIRSFRAELAKLVRWPAFWAILGVWAVLTLTFAYVVPFITYANPTEGASELARQTILQGLLPAAVPLHTLPGYPLFGGLIALVLGALTMGSEYGWGTWTALYLQQPRRSAATAGKLLALGCAVLGQVLVGLAAAAVASVVIAVSQDATIAVPPVGAVVASLAASWLIVMAWSVVGAVLAVLVRSTAVPIGIGFAYLLVDQLVGSLAGQSSVLAAIARGLVGTEAGALASSVIPGSFPTSAPGLNTLVNGPAAAGLLGAYVVAGSVLAGVLLVRRDVR